MHNKKNKNGYWMIIVALMTGILIIITLTLKKPFYKNNTLIEIKK